MINRNRLQLSKIALCVAIAVGSATVYAQNTTSALAGRITAVDGKSVAGAAVKIHDDEIILKWLCLKDGSV